MYPDYSRCACNFLFFELSRSFHMYGMLKRETASLHSLLPSSSNPFNLAVTDTALSTFFTNFLSLFAAMRRRHR